MGSPHAGDKTHPRRQPGNGPMAPWGRRFSMRPASLIALVAGCGLLVGAPRISAACDDDDSDSDNDDDNDNDNDAEDAQREARQAQREAEREARQAEREARHAAR